MAFDWGNAFRGGATGAAGGSTFGWPGMAIGGGLGLLGGFLGGNDNSEKWLNQIPDELKQYLMPYFNAGNNALGKLSGEYGNLINDPNALISRLGAGYKESPGYQWRLKQGEQGITNAAAAGGMAGTAQHQQQAGNLAENLANQDYQNYLNSVLGIYGTGLGGLSDISKMGFGAGSELGTGLANYLTSRAGLDYTKNANRNQMTSDLFSSLLAQLNQNRNSSQTDELIKALAGGNS